MDIKILDSNFNYVGPLDTFTSMIWNEKYNDVGELEIVIDFSLDALNLLKEDYYVIRSNSDRVMIIETINIKTDVENGNKLKVLGRTVESLLDRRIIAGQYPLWNGVVSGSLQNGIKLLLDENAIVPYWPAREIPMLEFQASDNPEILALTLDGNYYSQNLLDVIVSVCNERTIGFKMTMNELNKFVFLLYKGVDRSADQLVNNAIIFSPEFDNLLSSDYIRSKRPKKNYFLISGDPSASTLVRAQGWLLGEDVELVRREMFIDASNVSKRIDDQGTEIPDLEYKEKLKQIGYETLKKNDAITIFNGQIDLTKSYKYEIDFWLGDIVQIIDQFGHNSKVRITEMTFYDNAGGSFIYPTLSAV